MLPNGKYLQKVIELDISETNVKYWKEKIVKM